MGKSSEQRHRTVSPHRFLNRVSQVRFLPGAQVRPNLGWYMRPKAQTRSRERA